MAGQGQDLIAPKSNAQLSGESGSDLGFKGTALLKGYLDKIRGQKPGINSYPAPAAPEEGTYYGK